MTTTALDIITGAAKLIGVVFKSESLSADEANDGLVVLNDLLDSWSNDNLIGSAYTIENFPMTGAASYTMGVGGDFNTSRPINIVTAVIRYGSIDYPMLIIPPDQFQETIALKSIHAPYPALLTYDNAYPLATIKMYTIPDSGATLYLQSNKPLSNLSSLTATVDLPPGWKRTLIYNLALDLAPQYGPEAMQIAQGLTRIANQSLGNIKRSTSINNAMPPLTGTGRQGNIFSGWWS